MQVQISPSLMCMDLVHFAEQIRFFDKHANFLHIDIIDGHYVRNFALSPYFMKDVARLTKVPMDVHLMVTDPDDFLDMMAKAGAGWISPHAETISRAAFRTIKTIRDLGCRPGVVLNPATPLDTIRHYIHLLDKITFLTVDPGYAGQPFIPEVLDKIAEARTLRRQRGLDFLIEIDGACNRRTFPDLVQAEADVLILGSSGLFNLDSDIRRAWELMVADLTAAGASVRQP
jgi:D-allulose-6-phosphate 3-epimerase